MVYFDKIYKADLSHRAKAVYMYLKDHADSEGECWPGIRTIASELGLSKSTVKRALDELYSAELVSKAPLAGEREPQLKFIQVTVKKNEDSPPRGYCALAVNQGYVHGGPA